MGQTCEGKKDYMATNTVQCKFIYKGICICMSSQVAQWIAKGLLISKWLNCSHAVLRIPYCFPQLHVPIWSYFVYVSAVTHASPENKVIKRATTSEKTKVSNHIGDQVCSSVLSTLNHLLIYLNIPLEAIKMQLTAMLSRSPLKIRSHQTGVTQTNLCHF